MERAGLGIISVLLLFTVVWISESHAQEKVANYAIPPFEKRTCPVENGRDKRGAVDSLYQVPYCFKRGKGQNGHAEILDTLQLSGERSGYLFRIQIWYNRRGASDKVNYIVVVEGERDIYYDTLVLSHAPDNHVRHRSFRTVDVPETKRAYLWIEFFKTTGENSDSPEKPDTTQAYWTGRVHTFSLSDSPPLQVIDKYVSLRSPCAEEAGPDSSIPIRDIKIISGEVVEASQIDVRFPKPGIAVITPRTDSLTEILKSWVGKYALHSSMASEPIEEVEAIIADTSGCDENG